MLMVQIIHSYIISNSLKGHSVAPLALSGFLKIEGGEIGHNLGYFDKINVHRNFYEYGNKKCAQEFLSIMDKINVHRKNDDRLEDSQMG